MGQQPSTPLLGALCWCRDGIEPAARPVSCAMSRRPGLGRLRRRRLPRPPSGPFFWPARYFFAGPLFFPGAAAAALGWLKTRSPFQGHRRKRGRGLALSASASLALRVGRCLRKKSAPASFILGSPSPGGEGSLFSGRYPSSSEPWAGTLGPRRASPGLARRRPIDRDRGFRSRERTAEVLHLFGATGRA